MVMAGVTGLGSPGFHLWLELKKMARPFRLYIFFPEVLGGGGHGYLQPAARAQLLWRGRRGELVPHPRALRGLQQGPHALGGRFLLSAGSGSADGSRAPKRVRARVGFGLCGYLETDLWATFWWTQVGFFIGPQQVLFAEASASKKGGLGFG